MRGAFTPPSPRVTEGARKTGQDAVAARWHLLCAGRSAAIVDAIVLLCSVKTIADEIARYLEEHPDAADSLDGIRQWWLPRVRLDEATAQLEEALKELITRGIVVRQVMPDGRVLYRRAESDAT